MDLVAREITTGRRSQRDPSHGGPGFGRPPVVDDLRSRRTMLAQQFLVHAHDTRFAPLAGQEQSSKLLQPASLPGRGEEVVLRIVLSDGPQSGRRREEDVDLVFFQYAPESTGVRRANRFALEEDCGGAGEKGRVENVRVAYHPADVGCTEHDVSRADAEEIPDGQIETDSMAARLPEYSLGEASGSWSGDQLTFTGEVCQQQERLNRHHDFTGRVHWMCD